MGSKREKYPENVLGILALINI